MNKRSYLELRQQIYHVAGTIGHYAELSTNKTMEDLYISVSEVVDNIDKLCVEQGLIHAETGEILKTDQTCPKCGSENIANEEPENDFGELEVTCHDCSYQWQEESEAIE